MASGDFGGHCTVLTSMSLKSCESRFRGNARNRNHAIDNENPIICLVKCQPPHVKGPAFSALHTYGLITVPPYRGEM